MTFASPHDFILPSLETSPIILFIIIFVFTAFIINILAILIPAYFLLFFFGFFFITIFNYSLQTQREGLKQMILSPMEVLDITISGRLGNPLGNTPITQSASG